MISVIRVKDNKMKRGKGGRSLQGGEWSRRRCSIWISGTSATASSRSSPIPPPSTPRRPSSLSPSALTSSEKPLEWGKGLAQKRDAEERVKELELEMERPFARSRDDPELEKMLKDRIRWGDPMAHVVKRKTLEPILEDLGQHEKMKESGFIIPQTIPSHSWLKRRLDFPPNRYSIRPGRHWDGVDRSNEYEKQLFKRQNEKQATESEAYLWSVSDM